MFPEVLWTSNLKSGLVKLEEGVSNDWSIDQVLHRLHTGLHLLYDRQGARDGIRLGLSGKRFHDHARGGNRVAIAIA